MEEFGVYDITEFTGVSEETHEKCPDSLYIGQDLNTEPLE
jgi:hypothetical protein